jgi:hypothetical protein
MIKIDWVIVRSSTPARAAEFEFAVSELRRQLPDDARWLFGANVEQALNDERADSEALVLILEHPWLSLERRCIDRLGRALLQGYDTVEACDSRYAAPMAPGGYATQRGMERYVSAYDFHVEAATGESGKPDALVKLTTLGVLRRRSLHAEKVRSCCWCVCTRCQQLFRVRSCRSIGARPDSRTVLSGRRRG